MESKRGLASANRGDRVREPRTVLFSVDGTEVEQKCCHILSGVRTKKVDRYHPP